MVDVGDRLARALGKAERKLGKFAREAEGAERNLGRLAREAEGPAEELIAAIAPVVKAVGALFGLDVGEPGANRGRGIPAAIDLPALDLPALDLPALGEPWQAPAVVAPQAAPPAAAAPRVANPADAAGAVSLAGPGRGFPVGGPWLTHYGDAAAMGDLDDVAARNRVINIDADPGTGNFTPAQIQQLKAGGQNRVLSYLNLGSVEEFRDYWDQVPDAAKLGAYDGYPDETWMDPANPAWRAVVLDKMIPRLVAQGVDGFYLDNLELLFHGAGDHDRPLSDASRQAGLDLVAEIRRRYPNMLIVLQNGTGDFTRQGRAGGQPFAALLDGVSHEEVFTREDGGRYGLGTDAEALAEMRAWRDMGLQPGGRPLALAVQEYANAGRDPAITAAVGRAAAAEGFTAFVGDRSDGLMGQ